MNGSGRIEATVLTPNGLLNGALTRTTALPGATMTATHGSLRLRRVIIEGDEIALSHV